MLSRKDAVKKIFNKHGDNSIYITNTGILSREIYNLYPDSKNILYMQGSMGLSPAIGLGLAKSTNKDIIVFVGDGSLLMHLGITHTLRDENLSNLFVYVLDNGMHESVGNYKCSSLLEEYPGITEIIKILPGNKPGRVKLELEKNIKNIQSTL